MKRRIGAALLLCALLISVCALAGCTKQETVIPSAPTKAESEKAEVEKSEADAQEPALPAYEQVMKKYQQAVVAGDGVAVWECIMDPYNMRYNLLTKEIAQEELQSYVTEDVQLDLARAEKLYGKNLQVLNYKAGNVIPFTEEEVQKVSAFFEQKRLYPQGAIEDIVVMYCSYTLKGDDDYVEYKDIPAVLMQVSGKWYYAKGNEKTVQKWIDAASTPAE